MLAAKYVTSDILNAICGTRAAHISTLMLDKRRTEGWAMLFLPFLAIGMVKLKPGNAPGSTIQYNTQRYESSNGNTMED